MTIVRLECRCGAQTRRNGASVREVLTAFAREGWWPNLWMPLGPGRLYGVCPDCVESLGRAWVEGDEPP
jgi:hypothetical protein